METLTQIEERDRAHRVRAQRYETLLREVNEAERALVRLAPSEEDAKHASTLRKLIDLANTLPEAVHSDSIGDALVSLPGGSLKLRVVPMSASALARIVRRQQSRDADRAVQEQRLAAAKAALKDEFNE
jgi:hypothetical protein